MKLNKKESYKQYEVKALRCFTINNIVYVGNRNSVYQEYMLSEFDGTFLEYVEKHCMRLVPS